MQTTTTQRLERSTLWGTVFIDLVLVGAACFLLFQSRLHYLQGLQVNSHNLAQLLEQRIADKARLVDDAVVRVERALERQLRTGGIDASRLQWRLDLEQEQLPEIDAIRVTNKRGDVLWGKGIVAGVNASYADRAFFLSHQNNPSCDPIVTPPMKGKVSGLWVIATTRCYRFPDGNFAGVVSASVPVETFAHLLGSLNLGPKGTAVIRYADAGLIARMPSLEGEIGQPGNKKVSEEFAQLLASNQPAGDFRTLHTPDGVDRTYAFHRVQGWPFTIAVGLVEDDYLAPWRSQAIWGGILLGVLLLMTSTVAWMTIHHLRQQAIRTREHEEELARWRILLDQSLDGIVVLDRTGKVWEANRRFADMLGYSPEEVSALSVWDWDAQWSREELRAMVAQVGTEGAHLQTRHRRKDGRLLDMEISTNGAEFGGNKLIFCVCRDVSERNQAQVALQVSEEKYRVIFENQQYAISIFDIDTFRLLDVNDACVRMYGYSREELLGGMTIADLSDEPEASLAAVQQAAGEGSIFIPLHYHRKKDGTVVPVEIVGGPYLWNGCQVMFTLAHDITLRKHAEDELRESEALYRFLVTSLSDGFFACDSQGRLIFTNAAMARMCGVDDPAQLLGRHIFEFVAPVELERVQGYFQQALTQLTVPDSVELLLLKNDNQQYWAEVKPTVVARDQGLVSIQGLVIDITQRKQAAEALRKSEERLHLALQATRDAIWDWDLVAGQLYYSPRWFLMVGYKTEELQVDTELWRRLLHPDDLDRADKVVSEAIASKTFFEIETRLRHKAGHYVPVLTRGYVLRDDAGNSIRLAGTNTDLTEQKRIEEEVRQWERQALQLQKAESLSRMAGAIAHHFNNLLGVVLGNIEIAQEDLPPEHEVNRNLRAAAGAGERAVEVSSLLLTYLGQTEGRHEHLDLAALYRSMLPSLQSQLPDRIRLESRLPAAGPQVVGNGAHLQRLLRNLVANALESIGEGAGMIGLTLSVVPGAGILPRHRFPLDWEPIEEQYACLAVLDNGCGIVEADIEQLFDPFFSSKFTGRGLGLSVVMGIVRAHNGGIGVQSTMGQGSVFHVYLPLDAEAVALQVPGDQEPPPQRERTVLLVEDEEQVRVMSETMLTRLGFATYSAVDGAEALALFHRHREEIDVVVCDLTMPQMDGWETMEALRAIDPHIPFVMISGYDEARVMREGRGPSPQAFVQKPFRKEELGAAIEVACRRTQSVDEVVDTGS